jgi:hypothetical protein
MMMIPYEILQGRIQATGQTKAVIDLLLRALLTYDPLFDEDSYLNANPDVAISIKRGEWRDGRSHYVQVGYFEGRIFTRAKFSETAYLKSNPDVAVAIKRGEWRSAADHYMNMGVQELRAPCKEFESDIDAWRSALGMAKQS